MKKLSALFAVSLCCPALGSEYVVTSLDEGILVNYPLQPPAGCFVEVVQVATRGTRGPLKIDFVDGRSTSDFQVANSLAGFKMVGVSSITPVADNDHTILWKVTPAAEFAKNGATYRTILAPKTLIFPDVLSDALAVPQNSLVKVIGANVNGGSFAYVSLASSVHGLSVIRTELPVPSPSYPFLTEIKNEGATLLVEITQAESPSNKTVAIQQSDDLQAWETFHSFQIAPNRPKQFFRAIIASPAE